MSDDGEREVAGVWCHEVLERLPDLVDGALEPKELARIQAHVAGCDWCERFGGTYGDLVRSLRLARPSAPEGLGERLQRRLQNKG